MKPGLRSRELVETPPGAAPQGAGDVRLGYRGSVRPFPIPFPGMLRVASSDGNGVGVALGAIHARRAGAVLRMREPNAIDFWRGLALITIFVNHMPGNLFEPFMYSRYTISDATELFVFLAGWSLALATKRGGVADPPGAVIMRVATRTVEVYRAQLVITAIAFAMIAAAALYFDNPLLLEWHGAGAFFGAPIPSIIGWVALTYQLGYFNILPLYVVLLMLAPIFILIARASRWAALAASFALYMACLVYEIAMPS